MVPGDQEGGGDDKSGGKSGNFVNEQRSILSPYFLPTSDKPRDKIIHVVLTGDNYDEWSVKLRGALRSWKKTGFVDGSIKKLAEGSEDLEDWYMVNAIVVAWIFNVIEPSLGSQITYVEEAKILWDDINVTRTETGARLSNDKEGNTRPRCSECNRWGHTRDKCYDVIGHPSKQGGYRGGYSGGENGGGGGRGRGGGRGVAHASSTAEEGKSKEECECSKRSVGCLRKQSERAFYLGY